MVTDVRNIRRWLPRARPGGLLRNAALLFAGNTFASVLGFATLAITARALDPAEFGLLVLVQTYVLIVDQLVNFQSWQAVIKFGADSLLPSRRHEFQRIIKFGGCIDVATAVLATAVAVGAAGLAAHWYGWGPDALKMMRVYSIVVLFNIAGTPTGVLRLLGRFNLLSVQKVVSELFRACGAAVAFWMGAGVWGFTIVWMGTTVLGYLLLTVMAWRELVRRGYANFWAVPLRGILKQHPDLWAFVWTTNLNGGIRMASRELDMFLVGGVFGSAAAGLYKTAKQLSSVLGRLSDPFYQAIYPEFAKLWAKGRRQELGRLALRSAILGTAAGLCCWFGFVILGKWIIATALSPEFIGAYGVTVAYMFATVLAVGGFPLQPLMLAMGRPKLSFWVHLLSTALYYPVLHWCMLTFGLVGAGVAYIIYYAVWTGSMIVLEVWILRQSMIVSPLLQMEAQ